MAKTDCDRPRGARLFAVRANGTTPDIGVEEQIDRLCARLLVVLEDELATLPATHPWVRPFLDVAEGCQQRLGRGA
jgi:hypothetical protein